MKNFLSINVFLLILFQTLKAQTLESDNFNAYTIGNVGTDITASVPGQGGFYTDFPGGSNSEAQIVNIDASHGKSLQLIGSAGASATKFMWKNGLGTAWAARTSGNDILKLSFSLYTGNATGGVGRGTVLIYDGTTHKTLLGAGYEYDTQRIVGIAYYTKISNGVTGNYLFYLEPPTYSYPPNTWITLNCTFNKTTGAVTWTTPGGVTYGPASTHVPAAAGVDPFELDFVSVAGVGNTIAHITSFDDYMVTATNNATLVTREAMAEESNVSVYPNPAADFIHIQSESPVTKIEIVDIAGRKKDMHFDHEKIDIRNLTPGIYIITMEIKGSKFSKKFIKK